MKITDYKGCEIHLPTSGGKAGKGHQKTSTIQVIVNSPLRHIAIAFRFTMANEESRKSALRRAREYVDMIAARDTVTP